MNAIDVDFEVFKRLTMLRATEEVTYNDVIRELLGLEVSSSKHEVDTNQRTGEWLAKGVRFPVGTEFRAKHKGVLHSARVVDGVLQLSDGRQFDTPSAAATAITGNPVNGWNFWECRIPGRSNWQLITSLRKCIS